MNTNERFTHSSPKKITEKTLCLFFSILIVFSLSSCGQKSSLNQSETNAVKKVITSIDDYLDYKISIEELRAVVDEVQERLKSNSYSTNKQSSKTTDELISDLDSSTVKIILSNLSIKLTVAGLSVPEDDILKTRNELAEKIGETQRKQ